MFTLFNLQGTFGIKPDVFSALFTSAVNSFIISQKLSFVKNFFLNFFEFLEVQVIFGFVFCASPEVLAYNTSTNPLCQHFSSLISEFFCLCRICPRVLPFWALLFEILNRIHPTYLPVQSSLRMAQRSLVLWALGLRTHSAGVGRITSFATS